MYTFLISFYDMDGGDDQKFTIKIDLNCIDNEDLNGMIPDEYAWKRAVEAAMFYIKNCKRHHTLSLGSIEFISC